MTGGIRGHPSGIRITRRRFSPRTTVEWIVGEIGSLLRVGSGVATSRGDLMMNGLPFYVLDSSRVNYTLTRELYRNTHDAYKLGGGFAKPVVNATAGFMGVPNFRPSSEDDAMTTALENWRERHVGKIHRVNRNTLRDGDVIARLTYLPDRFSPSEEKSLKLELVPPEWADWRTDILTGLYERFIVTHPQVWTDDNKRTYSFNLVETVTANSISIEPDRNTPAQLPADLRAQLTQTVPNPLGFIPFVHFRNEAEEHERFGFSDLEPIEPFLKAYHDNMLNAMGASKMHGRPKVKIRVNDVKKFKLNNLDATERANNAINLVGREMIYLEGKDDDVELIAPQAGIEGIMTLAKYLFFCVVDVSETPEFAFGTAVASSKASVSEQMIPFAAKIRRKRGQDEEPWGEFGAMLSNGIAVTENMTVESYTVDQDWDEINARTDKDIAETISALVTGLSGGIDANLISHQSASDFLREFIPTMLPYLDPENPNETELGRMQEGAQAQADLANAKMGIEGPARADGLPGGVSDDGTGGGQVVPFARQTFAGSTRQPAPPRRRRRG